VSNTWLYLTAFQSGNASVFDPISGHVLREFPVVGDQAGMAVSPDGTTLTLLANFSDRPVVVPESRLTGRLLYATAGEGNAEQAPPHSASFFISTTESE